MHQQVQNNADTVCDIYIYIYEKNCGYHLIAYSSLAYVHIELGTSIKVQGNLSTTEHWLLVLNMLLTST